MNMNSPSVVRVAGPRDYDAVWQLMLMSYDENSVFPLHERKARFHVERAIFPERIPPEDTGIRGVVGVIGAAHKLEALAFLTIGTFWYSEALHLEEFMVFVHPDHRKSGHAKTLLDWMELQVHETGLPLMTGVFSESPRNAAKCRLYQRKFPKLGEFFYLKPKDGTMVNGLVAASS